MVKQRDVYEMWPLLAVPCAAAVVAIVPESARMATIGAIGTLVSTVMFIPQMLRVWRHRSSPANLLGVSLTAQAFVLTNACVWFIYGGVTGQFWPAAPGLVSVQVAMVTIVMVRRARRQVACSGSEGAVGRVNVAQSLAPESASTVTASPTGLQQDTPA